MIELLKKFFFDETAFTGAIRALLIGLGSAQASGLLDQVEGIPRWVGVIVMALGGFIRAGEKNPS